MSDKAIILPNDVDPEIREDASSILDVLLDQWDVLVVGKSFASRRAARDAFEHTTRFGGLSGGSATLPELGHVAIVLLEPTERFWAMHFDKSGCYVLGRRGERPWEKKS